MFSCLKWKPYARDTIFVEAGRIGRAVRRRVVDGLVKGNSRVNNLGRDAGIGRGEALQARRDEVIPRRNGGDDEADGLLAVLDEEGGLVRGYTFSIQLKP